MTTEANIDLKPVRCAAEAAREADTAMDALDKAVQDFELRAGVLRSRTNPLYLDYSARETYAQAKEELDVAVRARRQASERWVKSLSDLWERTEAALHLATDRLPELSKRLAAFQADFPSHSRPALNPDEKTAAIRIAATGVIFKRYNRLLSILAEGGTQ